MLAINGWTILAHPIFLDQLEKLTGSAEALKAKKPRPRIHDKCCRTPRDWALPFGPGFRLHRNHAYGAFPPFGFNPITHGCRLLEMRSRR